MAILGVHMSIAGGLHKAVERAHAAGCDCVQIFTGSPRVFPTPPKPLGDGKQLSKNNKQWQTKPLEPALAEKFQTALSDLKIKHPISHDSYLINMASPGEELWKKSIDAFVVELQRAEQLGIPYVVAHPGAYTTSSAEKGLKRIIRALNEVHQQTPGIKAQCLLETTAGQGTNLGWKFEHLATLLDGVKDPDRLGICFDTCHVFAAGYPMGTEKEYKTTLRELNKTVGVKKIRAFHMNDSLKPLGSRVDRHAAIGRGEMGVEPFRFLLSDRRFRKVPIYLETPKGEENGVDLDWINLKTLRDLIPT